MTLERRSPTIELYQAEWCPHSHRVRQRLTELGLDFVAHQVPVDPAERAALERATGRRSIPTLVLGDGSVLGGDEEIIAALDRRFREPAEAARHRAKAVEEWPEWLRLAPQGVIRAVHDGISRRRGRYRVRMRVWTIGHGTRTSEELVTTLRQAGVETLVDVRRFAGSRRNPQFNQAALADDLECADIAYLHLPDLGGRRSGVPGEDRFACLRVSAFRSYAAWMSSSQWQQAIAQALELASPCFMCAETLPWRCHRRLIADFLTARTVEVVHLLSPGATIEHRPFAEAEIRDGRFYLCGTLVA